MVPLALQLCTRALTSATMASDEAGVEQAEDAECDLVENSGKVPAVTTKVSKSHQKWDEQVQSVQVHTTVSAHHRAKVLCHIMVKVLCASDILQLFSEVAKLAVRLAGFRYIRLHAVCSM